MQTNLFRPVRVLAFAALACSSLCTACVSVGDTSSPKPSASSRPPSLALSPDWTPNYFYPLNDQSERQQDRDKYECHAWAVRQSGFDPLAASNAASAKSEQPTRPEYKDLLSPQGAAAGAVIGAVTGLLLGDARHGRDAALLGAAAGAVFGSSTALRPEPAPADGASRDFELLHRPPALAAGNYLRALRVCGNVRGYEVR